MIIAGKGNFLPSEIFLSPKTRDAAAVGVARTQARDSQLVVACAT
jgi:hypothetical protein